MSISIANACQALGFKAEECELSLDIRLPDGTLRIYSNHAPLLDKLGQYFAHILSTDTATPAFTLYALEAPAPELPYEFVDWQRELGKTGRKDSYVDIGSARLIRKVRTGMLFLQSAELALAVGPCTANDNQVINFINSQYMAWLQQRGWMNCHAAAIDYQGSGIAFAGFSGGGKSTLMLHAMEVEGCRYVTNDRLLIKQADNQVNATGIPKLPRVNPGTIIHNPRLLPMLEQPEVARLRALPIAELWDLEDKYDVDVASLYGKDAGGAARICEQTQLKSLIILNWQRNSSAAPRLNAIDIHRRKDLLAAVMKSPGPFYQYEHGGFYRENTALNEEAYLAHLGYVNIYEITGGIDFTIAAQASLDTLG